MFQITQNERTSDTRDVLSAQIEAPFLPKVEGKGDTSNFESYPESLEDDSPPLGAEENALFDELENF